MLFTENSPESKKISEIDPTNLPVHVALIMDGNGRWAKKRMLPRIVGHRYGMETLKKIVRHSADIGIKHVTCYAFSTENRKRPEEEVNGLMDILVSYIRSEIEELHGKNVKMNFIGFIDELPELQKNEIYNAMSKTASNTGLNLHIAVNYGGRSEILAAAKSIAKDCMKGTFTLEQIDGMDDSFFKTRLMTGLVPDPDLMIRTGGEKRLSNYLLYQLSYSEFSFSDVLWPDFTANDFDGELIAFQKRNRRYGAV